MNLYNVIEQMENSNVGKIVGKENAIQPNITSKKISLHKVEYIQPLTPQEFTSSIKKS